MITLDEAKTHLRVDQDDDDAAITSMITTAIAQVENYTGATFSTDAPAPVKSAALLLVGDLYEHREAQTERAMYQNNAFFQLLNPYRDMTV